MKNPSWLEHTQMPQFIMASSNSKLWHDFCPPLPHLYSHESTLTCDLSVQSWALEAVKYCWGLTLSAHERIHFHSWASTSEWSVSEWAQYVANGWFPNYALNWEVGIAWYPIQNTTESKVSRGSVRVPTHKFHSSNVCELITSRPSRLRLDDSAV